MVSSREVSGRRGVASTTDSAYSFKQKQPVIVVIIVIMGWPQTPLLMPPLLLLRSLLTVAAERNVLSLHMSSPVCHTHSYLTQRLNVMFNREINRLKPHI